ncbi:serine/threonine-protein kinase PAK 3-like [Chamaea fasciata]|uniref:serine/threonine-protein kinase PAK 3-like n=1 Tax=Chamaea fasciata TaxID=190680 RepID=UPI00336A5501
MIGQLAAVVFSVYGVGYSCYFLTQLARHLSRVFRGSDPEITEARADSPLAPSAPAEEANEEPNDHRPPAAVTPQLELSQTNLKAEPQAELPEAQSDIKAVKRRNTEDMMEIHPQEEMHLHQQRGHQQPQVSERGEATPMRKHPLSLYLQNDKEQLQAGLQEMEARIKAKEKRMEQEMETMRAILNALRQSLQKQVAIKKINLQGLRKKELTFSELLVMKMNGNPNLVNILDSYLVNEQFWLVMEYVDGGTLSEIISKVCLSEDEMAAISRECLQGLYFLHSKHVIHRDVKSHNILLGSDGSVKLVQSDFGLFAQLLPEQSRQSSVARTPGWMAPEVMKDQPYGPKADIWSLGIVGIHMVEGEVPSWNETPVSPQLLIATGGRPRLWQPNLFLPRTRHFLSCCLQTDEARRWSAKELLQHPFVRSGNSAFTLTPLIMAVKKIKKKE